jgi:hypothetical protein
MSASAASAASKQVTVKVRHDFDLWMTKTKKEGDVWLWMRNHWIPTETMTVIIRRWGGDGYDFTVTFIVYQMNGKEMDAHPCLSFASKDFLNNDEGFESFLELILNIKYFDSFAALMIHPEDLLSAWKMRKDRTDTFSYATKKRKEPVSAVAAEKRPKTI